MNRPPRPGVQGVSTFLVERYWPGVTEAAFTAAARRVDEGVEAMRRDGEAIRIRSSTLVPVDEAAYWVVEATSVDVVEAVYARAGLPVERIVVAVEAAAPEDVLTGR